ncbi:MAG: hypothetical protein ABII79_02330 [bacterium]
MGDFTRTDRVCLAVDINKRTTRSDCSRTAGQSSTDRPLISQGEGSSANLLWAESLLFAGISAFLLLISQLFPGQWYLSLFALIPFLVRVRRANVTEAMRLGFLLGFFYLSILELNTLVLSPLPAIGRVIGGTVLFTAFGGAITWTRRRWGFSPIFVALLWVAFEAAIIKLGIAHSVLGEAEFSGHFVHGLVVLFGFLIISFIIVLCNTLIIAAVEKAWSRAKNRKFSDSVGERTWGLHFTTRLFADKFYLVSEIRGPPRVYSLA